MIKWKESMLRPSENHPIISGRRLRLRTALTETISVKSLSWICGTWNMNVSLKSGLGWPRRTVVLLRAISLPLDDISANFTDVSVL